MEDTMILSNPGRTRPGSLLRVILLSLFALVWFYGCAKGAFDIWTSDTPFWAKLIPLPFLTLGIFILYVIWSYRIWVFGWDFVLNRSERSTYYKKNRRKKKVCDFPEAKEIIASPTWARNDWPYALFVEENKRKRMIYGPIRGFRTEREALEASTEMGIIVSDFLGLELIYEEWSNELMKAEPDVATTSAVATSPHSSMK